MPKAICVLMDSDGKDVAATSNALIAPIVSMRES